MPKLCSSNGKKAWHTLSINPRGCPPLATISLVQAVVISFYCWYNVKRILQTILKFFVVIWLLLIANINSALYCDRRKQMTSEFFNDVNRVVPKNIVSRKKTRLTLNFSICNLRRIFQECDQNSDHNGSRILIIIAADFN